nr:MAG TPA: D-ornithine 4,5-aminomutase alpha-subunit [Caudoviricetes sp.]
MELLRLRLLRLMGGVGIKANVLGEIFSSKGLLSDGTHTKL